MNNQNNINADSVSFVEINFLSIISHILRNWKIVILSMIIATILGTIYLTNKKIFYSAQIELRSFDDYRFNIFDDLNRHELLTFSKDEFVRRFVFFIQSDEVLSNSIIINKDLFVENIDDNVDYIKSRIKFSVPILNKEQSSLFGSGLSPYHHLSFSTTLLEGKDNFQKIFQDILSLTEKKVFESFKIDIENKLKNMSQIKSESLNTLRSERENIISYHRQTIEKDIQGLTETLFIAKNLGIDNSYITRLLENSEEDNIHIFNLPRYYYGTNTIETEIRIKEEQLENISEKSAHKFIGEVNDIDLKILNIESNPDIHNFQSSYEKSIFSKDYKSNLKIFRYDLTSFDYKNNKSQFNYILAIFISLGFIASLLIISVKIYKENNK